MKFTVFADLHYKKKMYAASVSDLETIFDRAAKHGAEAVICLGDFCNDFRGSPEIVRAFLSNRYGLPVYNVYGNHELETMGNTMSYVTPLLTNREVNWGHGITDGSVGYYYFDTEEIRFIALDTNYSYNPEQSFWEHNREGSWGAPGSAGLPGNNINGNSLNPRQLEWLRELLLASADEGKQCILLSHATLTKRFSACTYDVEEIERMIDAANERRAGTVIMCINGHRHTDEMTVRNGVLYFDVNAVRSGAWKEKKDFHYGDGQGFEFVDYDADGNEKSREHMDFNSLSQGKNTWFFDAPLSADVTIENGEITIAGSECGWSFGVVPELEQFGSYYAQIIKPCISDYKYVFKT